MDHQQLNAFEKIIPKYISTLEKSEVISRNYIQKIKNEIKEELQVPSVSIYKKDIAKFILIHQIEQGEISSKEEYYKYYHKSKFILDNLDKYEIDTIADSYFMNESEFLEEQIIYNHHLTIKSHYLKDDPDWFIQIGLKGNPFPSQDGLYLISKEDYEKVVLKTQLYNKYLEIIDQDPKGILNKSVIIYGDFGCGKTTFFDYLDYNLILNNIHSIRIIMNAKPSLSSIHHSFNESLFNELADYISDYSKDPRANIKDINQYNILEFLKNIQEERSQIGFIIFLDGLHKSQDQEDTALNFLIELQNILEFYRRKGISLTIFVAGSFEWREKINNNKKFSGSIFTLEKMDSLTANQSYEMLKRRFSVFSETKVEQIIKYSEIELLVTSIERSLATDINPRILIKYFLQNGFIFKNKIKIKPIIEEDVLKNIFDAIKNNKMLYNNLFQIKNEYSKEKSQLSKILKVISTTYDMGYFFNVHPFYSKRIEIFSFLENMNIIIKSEKYKKNDVKPYSLNQSVHQTFNEIENKVKFRPTHYLELLFLDEPKLTENKAEYTNILDTLKRFGENNPEYQNQIKLLITLTENDYFALINKIENTPRFNIPNRKLQEMNTIIERILTFIYSLAEEPFSITNQKVLFDVFKYTWLDNQVLTQYFNWIEGWNPHVNNEYKNKRFLKLFIDTYESLVFKIGKHILYNKILIVGSKFLNNKDKTALNSARALYYEKDYKTSIKKCHDLIETTFRNFIYNIMYFKYGDHWESMLPKQTQDYINNIKNKELKQYGEVLSDSGNSLFNLSRSAYSHIIDSKYLWKSCFSPLFGKAFRSTIKDILENVANLGHLEKHNRKEEDINKLAMLIQQSLLKSKTIIEKVNKAYINLINLHEIAIETNKIVPIFYSKENSENLNNISFDSNDLDIVVEILEKNSRDERFFKKFIDISNYYSIQDKFSLSYNKFIACLIYLIRENRIIIQDTFGASLITKLNMNINQ
ncbi:MAG: AAA family ATPase [Promethearchaeota archaeon]